MIEPGSTYVAMGSSFAAGPGITPVVHRGALRSGRNYAHQVATALSLDLVDVTSSGATTAHILREPQSVGGASLPPQIEAVTPDTRLVTVTAGGNDVGYIGSLTRAALLRWLPRWARRGSAPTPQQFEQLTTALADVVGQIRARAPEARVMIVDYLTVLGPTSSLRPEDAALARATAVALATAFSDAAARAGADLVRASEASAGHGVGSAQPWVTGFRIGNPRRGGPIPFHPTLAGMTAVADLVVRQL